MNPDGHPELPILVTSTDARTPKVSQAHANQRVELAWWLDGSQDQFRIAGFTHLCLSSAFPGTKSTSIPAEAAALKMLEAQGFDWDAKGKEVLDAMSPGMRAWWSAPKGSGTPLSSAEEQKGWASKSDEDKNNYETAAKNFALMLIDPDEVDWVALGAHPNKRTVFRKEGGQWVEQFLAP
ncbi:hypothetical protein C8Q80DRAFT_1126727 [Daedaleopsis nitida]|nr:hypothetical protein C8Q80DRAFT_1126727 [Daedaleopsis nitida]